jgi:hypothetical protein
MASLSQLIFRERVHHAIGVGLIIVLALSAAVFEFWPPRYVANGRVVEATVVRVGTYPVSGGFGGDLPILTVRLPDGSVGQVRASWSTAGNCMPGSKVPLLQRGPALQVGLSGCGKAAHLN